MFGVWQPYGPECIITTPIVQPMKPTSCNITVANKTNLLYANSVLCNRYRFTLTNLTTGVSLTPLVKTGFHYFRFSELSTYALNTVYSITVSVSTTNISILPADSEWSPESTACTVTSPSNYLRPSISLNSIDEKFDAICTPNPSSTSFNLNIETTANESLEILIYDVLGKLIERKNMKSNELSGFKFGNEYLSGIYNVIINQGENTKSIKIIKQ